MPFYDISATNPKVSLVISLLAT